MRGFYWRNLARHLEEVVGECQVCATSMNRRPVRALVRPRKSKRPCEVVAVDLKGHYPVGEKVGKYLLVVEDTFSCWVEALPIAPARTRVIVKHLEKEVSRWLGYPEIIISDNGPQFTGEV